MKVAISFLCYNDSSAPYLEYFLTSLKEALAYSAWDFFILAGDNSDLDFLENKRIINSYKDNFGLNFELINFSNNLGFAAAYNQLIQRADEKGAEYFLMLNPDILLEKESLKYLFEALLTDDSLGSVSPKLYYWDFPNLKKTKQIDSLGICVRPGLRFYDLAQGKIDDGSYDNYAILGPSGAMALFKMSALKEIKFNNQYFDERFFMYKEDCDLVYRLNRAGYSALMTPRAIAYHHRSVTVKKNIWQTWQDWQQRSRLTRSWSFVGQHLLFIKYWRCEPYFSRFLVFVQVIFYFMFSLFLANFLLKEYHKLRHYFQGID
jgi:GT2 family glycosyltransferase